MPTRHTYIVIFFASLTYTLHCSFSIQAAHVCMLVEDAVGHNLVHCTTECNSRPDSAESIVIFAV